MLCSKRHLTLYIVIFITSLAVSSAYAGFIEGGVVVSDAPGDQSVSEIISCPGGETIIVWKTLPYTAGHVRAQKLDPLGRMQWQEDGVPVSTTLSTSTRMSIVSDSEGGIFIAYELGDEVYVQHIGSEGVAQWGSDGFPVCGVAGDQFNPSICRDSGNGVIVCWAHSRSEGNGIYLQYLDQDGDPVWNPDGILVDPVYYGNSPRICADGQGGAFVSWIDSYDVYAQRIRTDGSLAWGAGSKLIREGYYSQSNVDISSNNRYGAVIFWENMCSIYESTFQMRIAAVDSTGLVIFGVRGYQCGGPPISPSVVVDDEGGLIISYLSDEYGGSMKPAVRSYDDNFVSQWQTGIWAEGSTGSVSVANDGNKGAHFLWRDTRTGSFRLYMQHFDSLGTRLYPSGGIAVVEGGTTSQGGYICSNGSGGTVVAWSESRENSDGVDVYASAFDYLGGPVSTLLAAFEVDCCRSGISLMWTLSQIDDGVAFTVERSGDDDSGFKPLAGMVNGSGFDFVFTDETAMQGRIYTYRVIYESEGSRHVLFETDQMTVPRFEAILEQNFPNPFNPATLITYYLPENCPVLLEIFDVSGKRVVTLIDESQEYGQHTIEWNGQDQNGSTVSSGTYFYRLKAGKEIISRKMVLLR